MIKVIGPDNILEPATSAEDSETGEPLFLEDVRRRIEDGTLQCCEVGIGYRLYEEWNESDP